MAHFKQAPPDAAKAARDGVSNYIPSRSQPNLNFACEEECDRTAKWELTSDGRKLYACDTHRREHATTARTYEEKRIR